MNIRTYLYHFILSVFIGLAPSLLKADGAVVDKVYHPYVDALESEIEYRSLFLDTSPELNTPRQIHKLAFGRAFGERFFGEAYLIGEKSTEGDFNLETYEFELKWQLSEQGEYAMDWGLLFEYENEFDKNIEEVAMGLLVEKEWRRWSTTANLFLIQEWGDDIDNEFETALSLQARYRYSRAFEPAIEFYKGQDTAGIGPVVLGNIRVGTRKNINWESGIIFGIDNKSPDYTFRFLLEYEF